MQNPSRPLNRATCHRRLVLRSPDQDRLFTPWFFGQAGDQSMLCGGGDCTLDLKRASVMDGEHAFMPNGNERSMQWAALYSSPSPSPAPTLGLYVGALAKLRFDAAANARGVLSTSTPTKFQTQRL